MNTNKMIKKLEYQKKVNPGHKTKYEQPLRPRSTVFKDKTKYDRKNKRKEISDATE